jgi:hypothetical protein
MESARDPEELTRDNIFHRDIHGHTQFLYFLKLLVNLMSVLLEEVWQSMLFATSKRLIFFYIDVTVC